MGSSNCVESESVRRCDGTLVFGDIRGPEVASTGGLVGRRGGVHGEVKPVVILPCNTAQESIRTPRKEERNQHVRDFGTGHAGGREQLDTGRHIRWRRRRASDTDNVLGCYQRT